MAMAAVSVLFTACSDDGYWDGYAIQEDTYSFAQSAINYSLTVEDELSEISVKLYRNHTAGEVTLPLNIEIDNTLMTPRSESVTFADGSGTAELIIDVDNSAIELATTYSASVSLIIDGETLTEDNLSITGPSSCAISLKRDYTWQNAGYVIMSSNWASVEAEILVQQAMEYNTDGNKMYRLVSPYYYLEPDYCPNPGYHLQFIVAADGTAVSVPVWQNIGEVYSGDYYYYLYCNPAQGHSFTNNGNEYAITGLWAVRNDTQVLGAVAEVYESFTWVEGWPGE